MGFEVDCKGFTLRKWEDGVDLGVRNVKILKMEIMLKLLINLKVGLIWWRENCRFEKLTKTIYFMIDLN